MFDTTIYMENIQILLNATFENYHLSCQNKMADNIKLR